LDRLLNFSDVDGGREARVRLGKGQNIKKTDKRSSVIAGVIADTYRGRNPSWDRSSGLGQTPKLASLFLAEISLVDHILRNGSPRTKRPIHRSPIYDIPPLAVSFERSAAIPLASQRVLR
jgi:hypothetical protein